MTDLILVHRKLFSSKIFFDCFILKGKSSSNLKQNLNHNYYYYYYFNYYYCYCYYFVILKSFAPLFLHIWDISTCGDLYIYLNVE